MSGAGKFLKEKRPSCKVIAIEPSNARVHVGAAPNAPGRKRALEQYSELWKAHGEQFGKLELPLGSLYGHGHWKEEMLEAPSALDQVTDAVWARGPPQNLVEITLNLQVKLEGPVLARLVRAGLPSVRKINLKGCSGPTGRIPDEIGN